MNETLDLNDRKGQTRVTRGMRNLKDWINSLNVIDIPLGGRKYSWRRGASRSKIDRMFCDPQCLTDFPSIQLNGMFSLLSDHTTLLLNLDKVQNWGGKPFKSIYAWLSDKRFYNLVHREWNALLGKPLHQKLKLLKNPINEWNRDCFGHVGQKIKALEDEIQKL